MILYYQRDAIRNRNQVQKSISKLEKNKETELRVGYISFLYETYVRDDIAIVLMSV
jgi:hypothetical protein